MGSRDRDVRVQRRTQQVWAVRVQRAALGSHTAASRGDYMAFQKYCFPSAFTSVDGLSMPLNSGLGHLRRLANEVLVDRCHHRLGRACTIRPAPCASAVTMTTAGWSRRRGDAWSRADHRRAGCRTAAQLSFLEISRHKTSPETLEGAPLS